MNASRFLVALVLSLIVGTCVVREDHWLRPFLANRLAVRCGEVSYGMYLMHGLAYNIVDALGSRGGLVRHGVPICVAATVVAFGAATLSYHTYEAFFLRMKEKFEAPPRTRPAHAGGA